MVCCLYKRVDYGTLKGHWFLKSNLKIKSTILHIKSITKRVLSVFIIFIKYFSFTNFEGLVVKYAPSFPPARARSSNFFICLLQERIKLYPLKLAWSHQFFKDLGWWSIRGLNSRPADRAAAVKWPLYYVGKMKGTIFPKLRVHIKENNNLPHGKFHQFLFPFSWGGFRLPILCNGSTIGNHLREQHDMEPEDIAQSFRILRKCQNKFDCLIFEMFFIQELKPMLNKQCDSIRAKLFV